MTKSTENRIKSLENIHRKLDSDVTELYNHSYADAEIKGLKQKKLKIKDEIHALKKNGDTNG
jgi:hypothetical protein